MQNWPSFSTYRGAKEDKKTKIKSLLGRKTEGNDFSNTPIATIKTNHKLLRLSPHRQ